MQGVYQAYAEPPEAFAPPAPFYSIPIQAPTGFYYAPAPAAAPLPAAGGQGRGREPPLQLAALGAPAVSAADQAMGAVHRAGLGGAGPPGRREERVGALGWQRRL